MLNDKKKKKISVVSSSIQKVITKLNDLHSYSFVQIHRCKNEFSCLILCTTAQLLNTIGDIENYRLKLLYLTYIYRI